MKTKLIIAVMAALLCVDSLAQENEKTWRWTAEAESWAGYCDNFDFGVGGNFGYQINQRFFAGLGTDLFFDDSFNPIVPLYVVAKIDILKNQNTPVVDIRGGLCEGRYIDNDVFTSLAFGYKVKGERCTVCPMVGWVRVDDANSLALRFAVEF